VASAGCTLRRIQETNARGGALASYQQHFGTPDKAQEKRHKRSVAGTKRSFGAFPFSDQTWEKGGREAFASQHRLAAYSGVALLSKTEKWSAGLNVPFLTSFWRWR
jgi:hypothetical protein